MAKAASQRRLWLLYELKDRKQTDLHTADKLRPCKDVHSHLEATLTFDVHKERVWRLYKSLELVLLLFYFWGWMQQIYVAGQHLHGQPISIPRNK